jgi:hypothetical protein
MFSVLLTVPVVTFFILGSYVGLVIKCVVFDTVRAFLPKKKQQVLQIHRFTHAYVSTSPDVVTTNSARARSVRLPPVLVDARFLAAARRCCVSCRMR